MSAISRRQRKSFLRATELDHDAYSVIWRYLARQHGGANGEAELAANAERLKSKDWPYPVIEMYSRAALAGRSLISRPQTGGSLRGAVLHWRVVYVPRR